MADSDLSSSAEKLGRRIVEAMRSTLGPAGDFIQLHEPEFKGNEWAYVKDCIDTGWVSSVGSYVDRIETMLAEISGAASAIACVNGTAALHISYLLAGIEAGHEVLVPALTFVATVNPLHYLGAIPHFIDSCPLTLAVDAQAMNAYLDGAAVIRDGKCYNRATGRRISVLVVTHILGHSADLDELLAVADRWKLVLVEDAAEALGTTYKDRHVGSFGKLGTLSFNGNKIVTTGGGGAILTNDKALGQRAKHLTTTAKVPHRWAFGHDHVGFNYRMPNLNAALGCAQLERLPETIQRKKALSERYETAFGQVDGVVYRIPPPDSGSNFWLNAIELAGASIEERDQVLGMLNDAGYMSRPFWTPMNRLPMNRDCPSAPLPIADRLEREFIKIPSSARLAELDSPA